MRNYIVIFLLLLGGCSHFTDRPKTDISQEKLIGKICLNSKTDSILRLFIDKYHCDSCIYELYIDKKDPFEYKLTMRSVLSTESYLQENHPVNYASVAGNLVFIYSGIEDFIDKNAYLPTVDIKKSSKSERIASLSYIILKDTSYFADNTTIEDFPFINATQMPTVIFEAPK